jgi:hypothetical protein
LNKELAREKKGWRRHRCWSRQGYSWENVQGKYHICEKELDLISQFNYFNDKNATK